MEDGLCLKVIYLLVDKKSNCIVIMVYGYMGLVEMMFVFVKMYYDWGYNVLVLDVCGYGKS